MYQDLAEQIAADTAVLLHIRQRSQLVALQSVAAVVVVAGHQSVLAVMVVMVLYRVRHPLVERQQLTQERVAVAVVVELAASVEQQAELADLDT
jgi:hypothetical protein